MASIAVPHGQIAETPLANGGHAMRWELPGTPGILAFGRVSLACAVEHLTASGAILRCAEAVAPWTVVTLHIDQFGKFHGRVLWQRGDSVGLQFLDAARATIQQAARAS
jgi:hypothetical protein